MKKFLSVISAAVLSALSVHGSAFSAAGGALPTEGSPVRGIPGEINELRAYALGVSDMVRGVDCTDSSVDGLSLALSKNKFLEKFSRAGILRQVYAESLEDIRAALANAEPGDEIIIKSGVYTETKTGTKSSRFYSSKTGTAENPIFLRSEDPRNPAVLEGPDLGGYVLYITGSYLRIEDLEVRSAQKGIVLDKSNHSVIRNCKIHDVAMEAVHFRDDSSYCLIIDSEVYNSGLDSPGMGEAIYVGSANSTSGYGYFCDYNTVSRCILGPGVRSECVDIKEQTTGTVVEYCTMYGGDISGVNSASAFIKARGNGDIVRYNECFQEDNPKIRAAFEAWDVAATPGYGKNLDFYGNVCHLGESDAGNNYPFAYIVTSYSEGCTVFCADNIRIPENPDFMYRAFSQSSLTVYD